MSDSEYSPGGALESPNGSPSKEDGLVKRLTKAFKRSTSKLGASAASLPSVKSLRRGKSARSAHLATEGEEPLEMPDEAVVEELYKEVMMEMMGDKPLPLMSIEAKWKLVQAQALKKKSEHDKYPPEYFLEKLREEGQPFLDKELVEAFRIQVTSQPLSYTKHYFSW